MFWEYKWIDGVLHFRSDPRADFIEADRQLLTRYATESDEQNRKLRTENERLREALKPFVPDGDYHPVLDGPVSDECAANANFWFDTTVGDIRRARAALKGEV